MKLGTISVLTSIVIFSAGLAGAETTKAEKIGVVDMQRALRTVKAGQKAKRKLEKEFNRKKTELQKEEGAIKKMQGELQKQSLVMSEKARSQKQAELQQRIVQFQEKTFRSQAEIQKREQDLTSPIINGLRAVIQALAKKKGYTMVLEKNENAVLFSLEKDDLTSEVINIFNKKP